MMIRRVKNTLDPPACGALATMSAAGAAGAFPASFPSQQEKP
jgi:hypothetical protein